jgi:hypothetical protein
MCEPPEQLESKFNDLQLRLAVEMYNKRGAEGQRSHGENGIDRSYFDENHLLEEVIPFVGKML